MASSVPRALKILEPVRLRAKVVRGFRRGSKQLGFPTANLHIPWDTEDPSRLPPDERAVLEFAERSDTGIYCGLACIEEHGPAGGVHRVAMSMGWNPTFTDLKAKTIEPWLMHTFEEDFYGCHLRLLVLGYIRPEVAFGSVEELVREIAADGDFCRRALDAPPLAAYFSDAFLHPPSSAKAPATSAQKKALRSTPVASRGSPFPASVAVGGDLRQTLAALPPRPKPGGWRVLLVRHGESVANEQGLLSGGGDDSALTARGCAQLRTLAAQLPQADTEMWPPKVIASSALCRATGSADILADHFAGVERRVLGDLREMDYGDIDGAPIKEVRARLAEVSRRWSEGEVDLAPARNGESPRCVASRAWAALDALRLDLSQRWPGGGSLVLICHSWIAKALIATALPELGLAALQRVPQRNGGVSVLHLQGEAGPGGAEVLAVDLVASEPASARASERHRMPAPAASL
eukprot:TRINITY_DN29118_c0_g1_i1.p1 TRINITY_DN29118_c0_g1~~TRINITY_DN29118_c0_g1_i1.p1  ORF type:complete len:488 (+),score=98.53 TRINITY_DN29118_c0_g1_i1:74-1465(+)